MSRPRVVLLRGYSANPWDLQPWRLLVDRFDVRCLVPGANEFDADAIGTAGRCPCGRRATGCRAGARPARCPTRSATATSGSRPPRRGADIVHAAEIATWFSAQAAGLKQRLGFRLVLTVWETIAVRDDVPLAARAPLPRARRWPPPTSSSRRRERARDGLLLEGVARRADRGLLPGHRHRALRAAAQPRPAAGAGLVLSPGAARLGEGPPGRAPRGRRAALRARARARPMRGSLIVGAGPGGGASCAATRDELGARRRRRVPRGRPLRRDAARLRAARRAWCSRASPRKAWEEQFGMVLAEALAAGHADRRVRRAARSPRSSAARRACSCPATGSRSRAASPRRVAPPQPRVVRDPERVAATRPPPRRSGSRPRTTVCSPR